METKILNPTIDETIRFIQQVHTAKDWGGLPYWQHPLAVMHLLPEVRPGVPVTPDVQLAALLHDTIEDTDETAESLLARGYSPAVVQTVVRLSRPKDVTYFDYIHSIVASGDENAMWVKLADNAHNNSLERYILLPPDRQIMARNMRPRYDKAKALISAGLGL